jgi:Transposase
VYDKFHIIQHVNDAIDEGRSSSVRENKSAG